MSIRILDVSGGSIADRAGIRPGELLLRINAEDVLDEIDYQALTTNHKLTVEVQGADGLSREVSILKDAYSPLGLTLDERSILTARECANHCVFCFVDQLPAGMRDTLYVRDDDWRLSLMMGNFVTLTNVGDREFDRILRRKASPLYISVHATDPETRIRMLRNRNAGNIMERLRKLRDHHLKFHCQVVLCPGLNDGAILHQTIVDLAGLYPAALSLAVVPVGLTGHREGLPDLKMIDRESARELIRDLELIQAYYHKTLGTRFVYASDEFYSIAELEPPSDESYEDYPQIENGVGMLRQMAQECEDCWPEIEQDAGRHSEIRNVVIPTGVSALRYIRGLVDKYASERIHVRVIPVKNHFFGETVTVTGLIVGRDLISALKDASGDEILISASMLRENTDSFLDDMTLEEVQSQVGIPIRVVPNTGEGFLKAIYGLED